MKTEMVVFERSSLGWICRIYFCFYSAQQSTKESMVVEVVRPWWIAAYFAARHEAKFYIKVHGAKKGEREAKGWLTMHDPMTVAHEIKWPWKRNGYRDTLVTIWHVDTEKDGSDDSCGWFMRARHCDQATMDRIAKRFEFEWAHGVPFGWFNADGEPNFSPQAITLGMFLIAANEHFGHWSRRAGNFLRRHLFEILHFAENNFDSLYTFISQHYGKDKRDTTERRAREASCIVYAWICREDRPWWKHPRWHFWHWKIQFHPWQNLKRRFWDKCCVCGKRGFHGESAIGNWNDDKIWHSSCDQIKKGQL